MIGPMAYFENFSTNDPNIIASNSENLHSVDQQPVSHETSDTKGPLQKKLLQFFDKEQKPLPTLKR